MFLKPRTENIRFDGSKAYWSAPTRPSEGKPELMLLIELEIKLPKDTKAVRIEATAIGGAIDSTTRQGFRGHLFHQSKMLVLEMKIGLSSVDLLLTIL